MGRGVQCMAEEAVWQRESGEEKMSQLNGLGSAVFTEAGLARLPCIPSSNVCIVLLCEVGWLIPPQNRLLQVFQPALSSLHCGG